MSQKTHIIIAKVTDEVFKDFIIHMPISFMEINEKLIEDGNGKVLLDCAKKVMEA